MSFHLTNTLATFMDFMKRVFKQNLDMFVIVFIDDILINSRNEDDHANHFGIVLQNIKDRELYAKFESCSFIDETSVKIACLIVWDIGE